VILVVAVTREYVW